MLVARLNFSPFVGAWAAADTANSNSPATRQVIRFIGHLLSTTLKPLKPCTRSWHHRWCCPCLTSLSSAPLPLRQHGHREEWWRASYCLRGRPTRTPALLFSSRESPRSRV